MRVYISGKISGKTLEQAEADFAHYAQIIRENGHEPVNPMRNGLPFDAPWADHMERDLALLKTCDAICLLPDWVVSTGAQIEVQKALATDMLFMNDSNLSVYLQMYTEKPEKKNSISRILQHVESVIRENKPNTKPGEQITNLKR